MFKCFKTIKFLVHLQEKRNTWHLYEKKKLRHPQRSDKSKSWNKETQAIVHLFDLFHSQRDKSLVFINIDCLETCWGGRRINFTADVWSKCKTPLYIYLCMWWQEHMWPGCTVCLGSLHPHYVSWTDVRVSCTAHSWKKLRSTGLLFKTNRVAKTHILSTCIHVDTK